MSEVFLKADEIFTTAEKSLLQPFRHNQIESAEYLDFTKSLKNLIRLVRLHEIQEFWWPVIENLRKLGLFYGSSILNFSELLNIVHIEEPDHRLFDVSDQAVIDSYELLKQSIEKLRFEDDLITSAFIQIIKDLNERYVKNDKDFNHLNGFGILCAWDGLLKPIVSKVESLGLCPVLVVRPYEMKIIHPLYHLSVFGTSKLYERYSGYIFSSPRSKFIDIFAYSNFRQPDLREYPLEGSPRNFSAGTSKKPPADRRGVVHKIFSKEVKDASHEDSLKKEDGNYDGELIFAPMVFRKHPKDDDNSGWDDPAGTEKEEAILISLSDYRGVWVKTDGTIHKVEVEIEDGAAVCEGIVNIGTEEAEAGDILIFSTEGGGDMISNVANSLLGKEAEEFRRLQNAWKHALREKIRSHGFEEFSRILQKSGLELASPQNLRNWISGNPSVIGPKSRKHHQIIISECGLDVIREKIFQVTDNLRTAHRSAGIKLSEFLIKQIKGSLLDDLRSTGKQEFGGTEEIPNQKTMFFIEEIGFDTVLVPSHEIGRPFRMFSKILWQK